MDELNVLATGQVGGNLTSEMTHIAKLWKAGILVW
jgi:hypothetical protein